MSCLSAEEILKYGCRQQELCCPNEALEAALEAATDAIEVVTGQWVCPREVCFKVRGSGTRNLYFPPAVIAPVISIRSIKKNGTCITDPYFCSQHYVKGTSCFDRCEYEICGEFGYETIPPLLKRALVILALEYAQPGVTGYANPQGVTRADWSDFSVSYRVRNSEDVHGRTTGIFEVDRILANYINYAGMFMAIQRDGIGCCNNCGGDCATNCNSCG